MHEDSHIHQEWALKLNPLTGAKRFQVLFEYLQNTCQLYFILNLYILMKAHITLKIFMRANIYHIYYCSFILCVVLSKGSKNDTSKKISFDKNEINQIVKFGAEELFKENEDDTGEPGIYDAIFTILSLIFRL